MDRRKYIAALVEKTGVRLDEDDPIFAVVMLNQLILEDQKTELEALVGQLVKVGGAVRGEVIKQVEAQCNATLLQLKTEAAELKTDLEREHAEWRKATRGVLQEEIGGTIGRAAGALKDAHQSIMRPVLIASIVSGIASGVVVAFAMFIIR